MKELKLIYHYNASDNQLKEWAKDIFMFTYLCNGMNLKDIARLKYKNIKGNELIFVRAKTEFTRKKGKREIVCKINPDIQRIIDRWGVQPVKPDGYIFEILKPGITAQRERELIQNANSVINDYLKLIATDCKINKTVTTYTARHTFASIGTAMGVPLAYISQDLGHSDARTTQAYIEQIESDETDEARRKMTDFGE
jgi:integrase